jgi:hypothetical protein
MALNIVMFPEAFQELSKEITFHPQLQEKLQWKENSNLDATDKIAVIAAHCDVVLDGMYSPKDLEELAGILTQRLKQKRVEIILPVGPF